MKTFILRVSFIPNTFRTIERSGYTMNSVKKEYCEATGIRINQILNCTLWK